MSEHETRKRIRAAISQGEWSAGSLRHARQNIGGVAQLAELSIDEMTNRRHDLEYQLALCESMVAEGTILPYPFERAVVLLRKQKRYADELRLCEYVRLWCEEAESLWDGRSAMHWRSPKLQKCVDRIPKLQMLIQSS